MKTTKQLTLDYYKENADAFCARTQNVSFNPLQERFEKYLPQGASILDFGCGSGRDAIAFQKAGFDVTALDGTAEFIERLEKSGLKTVCCTFDQFCPTDVYDGIWACASLLHLESDALQDVLTRIFRALRPGGVFYCSMKKGDFQGMRNGRYFLDQTADSLRGWLERAGFSILELFETEDVRPQEKRRPWINAVCTRH